MYQKSTIGTEKGNLWQSEMLWVKVCINQIYAKDVKFIFNKLFQALWTFDPSLTTKNNQIYINQ